MGSRERGEGIIDGIEDVNDDREEVLFDWNKVIFVRDSTWALSPCWVADVAF